MDKVFKNLGASNHKKEGKREEDDFYTTDSNAGYSIKDKGTEVKTK